jgi:glycosyltransferase involved in cell wall biosynthesis
MLGSVVQLVEGGEGYGVAEVLRRLSREFPEIGFCALFPGSLIDQFPPARFDWIGSEPLGIEVTDSTLLGIMSVVRSAGRLWHASDRLAKALPKKPLLLHCHNLFILLLAGLVKLRRADKTKIVFHFHSTMNPRRLLGFLPAVERALVGRLADGIIAVSEAAAECWRPCRIPVTVVYNGIEPYEPRAAPSYYTPQPGVRDIVIAGSLSREKGHLEAVEAMRCLGNEVPGYHLWIAGGPLDAETNPFVRELRERIRRYGLDERITLLGHVSDLQDLLPRMWAALQQRITPEPGALWVLEVMRAGIPLIASATGGTPEYARNGQEALLVTPGCPEQIAAAIRKLADEEGLWNRLAASGRVRANEFSAKRFRDAVAERYAALLGPATRD